MFGPIQFLRYHGEVRNSLMRVGVLFNGRIPEACSLILKTGGVGEEQSLYTLDMGEPLKIRNLARQMIRFYGFEPEKEISIRYIGLRPGEKMTEKLWGEDEVQSKPGILTSRKSREGYGSTVLSRTCLTACGRRAFLIAVKPNPTETRNI